MKLSGPWSDRGIDSKINMDINQVFLQFWSEIGDSSLNEWWVIERPTWSAESGKILIQI